MTVFAIACGSEPEDELTSLIHDWNTTPCLGPTARELKSDPAIGGWFRSIAEGVIQFIEFRRFCGGLMRGYAPGTPRIVAPMPVVPAASTSSSVARPKDVIIPTPVIGPPMTSLPSSSGAVPIDSGEHCLCSSFFAVSHSCYLCLCSLDPPTDTLPRTEGLIAPVNNPDTSTMLPPPAPPPSMDVEMEDIQSSSQPGNSLVSAKQDEGPLLPVSLLYLQWLHILT